MHTTRRTFLQMLGATLLVRSARSSQATGLVVGAGMAGVAAAARLHSQGIKVTVLEARNRLGGRIWTDGSLGFPLDMGAMWIEGTQGNPVAEQARRLKVRTIPDPDDWLYVDYDGRRLDYDEEEEYKASLLKRLEELSEELDGDISSAEAVKRVLTQKERSDPFYQRRVRMVVSDAELTSSAPADRISFLHGSEYGGYGGPQLLMPDGYLGVVAGLARGLDIRQGHRVTSVAHSSKGVRVVTDKGALEADFAIVTLPLGVLKAGMVTFEPALPADKLSAIRRLEMGLLNKVILKFPKANWPAIDEFGYLSNVPGEFPMFLNWQRFSQRPVLIGFVAGKYARELEGLSDSQQADRAMAVLRKIAGSNLAEPDAVLVSRWSQEKFTGGSYSYVPVGSTLNDYDVLARPVGRLLFAGEATDRELFASVNGAYVSGVREADRAVKLFS
ncbi:MAG: putative putrescine oxidase [Candidatus Xenobia bacterium]